MKKPKHPKFVRTAVGIANLIRAEFKMSCDRQRIKNWQTRHTPPFPFPNSNNEFDVEECFAWVRALQKRKGKTENSDSSFGEQMFLLDREADKARAHKHITAAQRDQFELDKEMGLFIERAAAEQTIRAAMNSYHGFVKTEIEIHNPSARREKLIGLGVSEEIAAKFYEFDLSGSQSTIDKIEKRCEKGFEDE